MSGCKLLALIRLVSAPVSSMKTSFRYNSSTDMVVMGETGNLLGFTTTLLSLLLIPSPESLSHSSNVFYSGPLEIHLLASRDFACFLKNFVNYCIGVCDIPQFCVLYSYNEDTAWSSVHFLSLPIHCSFYLHRYRIDFIA